MVIHDLNKYDISWSVNFSKFPYKSDLKHYDQDVMQSKVLQNHCLSQEYKDIRSYMARLP